MQNNAPKIIFIVAIVGVIGFIAVEHPAFFISENPAAGSKTIASSTVVDPTLSADITAAGSNGSSNADPIAVASTTVGNASNPPSVGAEISLIADLSSGKQYLGIRADERWPMASISKLMTAVVATNVLGENTKITITKEMTAADPSQKILQVGDTYTVSDLLRIMLLPSNNVAAEALAQFYGRTRFLAAMNTQAQAWGMTQTFYDDPSGLSAANESTANDLFKLAQHIDSQYPEIFAITRTPKVTVQNLTTNKSVLVTSINNFAGHPDFIGGKTGYTDQADGNLLSVFDYNNHAIVIVVLGIDDGVRFDATQELYNWFKANFV